LEQNIQRLYNVVNAELKKKIMQNGFIILLRTA